MCLISYSHHNNAIDSVLLVLFPYLCIRELNLREVSNLPKVSQASWSRAYGSDSCHTGAGHQLNARH